MKNFMKEWLEWVKEYYNWCKSVYKSKYFWATMIAMELVLWIPYGIYLLVTRIEERKAARAYETYKSNH